jgi:hypothetical protein
MAATPFNIGQSVNNYIAQVNGQGSLTASDVLELTTHLYDAVDDLKRHGLSEEEAFIIACKRLGSEYVLHEEYSKVNATLNTNKVWVYMIVGFNLLFSAYSMMLLGLMLVYFVVARFYTTNSDVSSVLVTCLNICACIGIWYAIKQKDRISKFIETAVQNNALRSVVVSFILLGGYFMAHLLTRPMHEFGKFELYFGAKSFNNGLVEFSFYLIRLCIVAGAFSVAFGVDKPGKVTLRSLFEKPSTLFLVLFGLLVEFTAASTRVVFSNNIMGSAVLFGLVYFAATFCISFYNKQTSIKQILRFAVFGLSMESIFGTMADVERGNTHFVIYFMSATLICIFIGKVIGTRLGKRPGLVAG